MYANDIYLMAHTGTAMQNLLDVCHNLGTENDISFNHLKSSVNMGSETLRFVNETNYFRFTFCNLNKDDKDILRQMRYVYARSNRLLRMFNNCSIDVKIGLLNSYCTSLCCSYKFCRWNTRKRILVKFE